jgi:hypothetical protein
MGRECRIIVACGKKGVGKSVETIRMIYEYVNGNPEKGVPPRKALIFDVNDEFSDFWFFGEQHKVKSLAIKDIQKFSVSPFIEVRRIRPYHDDGKRMTINDMAEVLSIILDTYRNGLLLVEDVNKYTGDYMQTDLIGALATARHIGVDCVMHFQGVGRSANPKIIGNCNFIRLHKTNDSVMRHKNKFEEKTEILYIAETIVNNRYRNGDKRFFVYVNIDDMKIIGKFKKEEVDTAIDDYIEVNRNKLLKPLLNKRNLQNEKVHTNESAVKKLHSDLYDDYFKV